MQPAGSDVERLSARIDRDLPARWAAWPGGWPGEIEVALIDAVFSIQSRYAGVQHVIDRWRASRGTGHLDDLAKLTSFAGRGDALAELLGNRQRVPGGSALKAEAVVEAATRLVCIGVSQSDRFDGRNDDQRRAYTGVKGLGEVTWIYLGMLLGTPGVKADTMIQRFVSTALGRAVGAEESRLLVEAVAKHRCVSATTLDNAIWSYQRGVSRSGRPNGAPS
jgi:hypothetical protein